MSYTVKVELSKQEVMQVIRALVAFRHSPLATEGSIKEMSDIGDKITKAMVEAHNEYCRGEQG